MESEKERKAREARDKVVNRACAWLARRSAKAGLTGAALDAAKGRQNLAENDLAEATEKYQKES